MPKLHWTAADRAAKSRQMKTAWRRRQKAIAQSRNLRDGKCFLKQRKKHAERAARAPLLHDSPNDLVEHWLDEHVRAEEAR